MRAIHKGREPASLTEHRQRAHCDYDNYPDKATLRDALVTEQRGLCCYCMGRIGSQPRRMKIEHWHSREHYQGEQLEYRDLLGACLGGEGQPRHQQHCDTRKGDRDLLWNPADPAHRIETRVRYEVDGSIRSDDNAFDAQIEDVLNLNLRFLMNARKGLLDGILSWWRQERARRRGPVPRARFQRERDRRVAGTSELRPYSQVAAWWLEQR